MNLARAFSYTRLVETQLAELAEEHASCEENAQEAFDVELAARIRDISDRYEAELERARADTASLRNENGQLLDRLLLALRSVPVNEPLRNEKPATAERANSIPDLLNQTKQRSGPVAAARQDAEDAAMKVRENEADQRRRVPKMHLAGTDVEAASEDLSDVMAQ